MNKKIFALFFILICALSVSAVSAENADSFSNLNSTIVAATDTVDLSTDYVRGSADPINAINISKDITINGNGKTIDGDNKGPIFTIDKDVTVTINDLIFINGKGDYGGAIANYGKLILNNCKFLNNTATYGGGAVYNSVNSNMNIVDSQFVNNTATYYGGAISNDGVLDVDNVNFQGNTITYRNSTGLDTAKYAGGAAVYNTKVATIKNSEVNDNAEDYLNGHIMYGAVASSGNLTVVNTRFNNNHGRYGGAVAAFDYNGVLPEVDIINCTFENNTSIYGGGVYVNGPNATIAGCNFTGNNGTGKGDVSPNNNNGGALVIFGGSTAFISDCRFANNTAHYGGAISIGENNGITVNNCVFENNNAKNGGAIEISSKVASGYVNIVNINNSTFDASYASANGGSIYNTKPFVLNIDNCTFTNSTSKTYGGAIYTVAATATIKNSLFLDNGGLIGKDIYYTRPAATITNITSNSKGVSSSVTTIVYKNVNFITEMSLGNVSVVYNDDDIVIFVSGSVNTANSNTYVIVTMGDVSQRFNLTGNTVKPATFKGNFTIAKEDVEYGVHDILVSFPEQGTLETTGHWYACEANTEAVLELLNTTITLDSIENYTDDGRNITVKGITSNIENGTNITIAVNDRKYNVAVVNNTVSLDLGVVAPGIYTVAAKYGGNLRYSAAEDAISFTNFINTSVTLNPIANVTYGNPVTISGSTSNITKGSTVSIKIGDEVYNATVDENGNFSYVIDDIGAGNHTVEVAYGGNATHASSSAVSQFNVAKANTTVEITGIPDLVVGESGEIVADVKDAGGNVIGTIAVQFNANAAGNFTVPVSFDGDDNYLPSTANATVKVADLTYTLEASDVVKYFNNGTQYTVKVTDYKGNPVSNKTVALTLTNPAWKGPVTYYKVTDDDGVATLPIGLYAGTYGITAVLDDESVETTITVLPMTYSLESEDIYMTFKDGTSYTVTVVDADNNPVAGKTVAVTLTSPTWKKPATYNIVTDENGVANLPLGLSVGKYGVTAAYGGESVSTTINVLKSAYKIETSDVVKYFKNGTQYTVTVKDLKNNPVEGKTVSVTLSSSTWKKPVTYNITTDENGVAVLPIGLSPGSYTASANVDGNIVKTSITVLPVLTTQSISKPVNQPASLYAKLVDGQGNPAAGKTVTFTVNTVTYYKTTDANGIATLPIGLCKGKWTILVADPETGAKATAIVTVTKAIS